MTFAYTKSQCLRIWAARCDGSGLRLTEAMDFGPRGEGAHKAICALYSVLNAGELLADLTGSDAVAACELAEEAK